MVLECFQGFVDRIEGLVAYVTLESEQRTRLTGPYPAADLTAAGVGAGDRFSLTTIASGDSVQFEIMPVPPLLVSGEEQQAILQRIKQRLGGYLLDDD